MPGFISESPLARELIKGPVEPIGHQLEWEVIGIFRYDDGRLAEEWVQTDYRSFLTMLGVTTTESTQRGRPLLDLSRVSC
jgi:hypothetical protein